jgi:hypothetical protein
VSPEQLQAGGTVELPPGPRGPGATPSGVVRGFVAAQSSADGDHAIARQFLAPEVRGSWDDDAGVQVYDPQQLVVEPSVDTDGATATVRVTGVVRTTVGPDGSIDPEAVPLRDSYQLRDDPALGWVLTDVPPGLRLSPLDVERSFQSRVVYYLARGAGQQGHLVPDAALLAVEDDPAPGLVRRLLAGPSATLIGAVDSAAPEGAQVLDVTTDAAGVVTVDLGPEMAMLTPAELERLSAQLVWTLREASPTFAGLRLLAAGQPVAVPGVPAGGTQERTAWPGYDPDGLPDRVATYYVQGRQLRILEQERAPRVVDDGEQPVDLAAVSPRTDELAALTQVDGRWEVRTGPMARRLPAQPDYTAPALGSPSWGSGRRGLWMLQSEGFPTIVLLAPDGQVRTVPVDGALPGRLWDLRVSRDGARIALVAGEDEASRRVFVGTVVVEEGEVRIRRPREVGIGVSNVSDVAWETGTSLVAVGELANAALLPLRLPVDGSGAVDRVRLPGLEQLIPQTLAAATDQPLVVAASRDERPLLLRADDDVFSELPEPGSAPFYPG